MQRTLFDASPEQKLSRDTDKATSHAAAPETIPKLNRIQSLCLQSVEWSDPRRPLTANEIAANAVQKRERFVLQIELFRVQHCTAV